MNVFRRTFGTRELLFHTRREYGLHPCLPNGTRGYRFFTLASPIRYCCAGVASSPCLPVVASVALCYCTMFPDVSPVNLWFTHFIFTSSPVICFVTEILAKPVLGKRFVINSCSLLTATTPTVGSLSTFSAETWMRVLLYLFRFSTVLTHTISPVTFPSFPLQPHLSIRISLTYTCTVQEQPSFKRVVKRKVCMLSW